MTPQPNGRAPNGLAREGANGSNGSGGREPVEALGTPPNGTSNGSEGADRGAKEEASGDLGDEGEDRRSQWQDEEKEALYNALHERFVLSGAMMSVRQQIYSMLEDTEWEARVVDYAKERAAAFDMPSLAALQAEVMPRALQTLPEEVKEVAKDMIMKFLDENVED